MPGRAARAAGDGAISASRCGGRRRRKGFSDEEAAWIDGLAQRLDIANRIAELVRRASSRTRFIETALGPLASDETRQDDRARREPAAGARPWR